MDDTLVKYVKIIVCKINIKKDCEFVFMVIQIEYKEIVIDIIIKVKVSQGRGRCILELERTC